ncbi:MAG: hypothetical protein HY645_14085 [Acidobacteria bacterium]|nr:hypothetical protein [Acidobacteriota bacterium]
MPQYISCHTIACMTVQQVRQLAEKLKGQPQVKVHRIVGSQVLGKILMEAEADARENLERVFEANHIHYEWIFRVEFDERTQQNKL